MLALAAFAAVTTAFTGIPGYVKPRFTVLSSTNGGARGSGGAGTDSARWQVCCQVLAVAKHCMNTFDARLEVLAAIQIQQACTDTPES